MKERIQFTCPKCGSHLYGSRLNWDGSYTRCCHGCYAFVWPEVDDVRYFKATGTDSPPKKS